MSLQVLIRAARLGLLDTLLGDAVAPVTHPNTPTPQVLDSVPPPLHRAAYAWWVPFSYTS